MPHTSLMLFFDVPYEELDWEKVLRLPLMMIRLNVPKDQANKLVKPVSKALDNPAIKSVYVMSDDDEAQAWIANLYQQFSEKHHCDVHWEIADFDVAQIAPKQEAVSEERPAEGPMKKPGVLVIFFGKPMLNPAIMDPDQEPTMAIFNIQGATSSQQVAQLEQMLKQNGLEPAFWFIYPSTPEYYDYFERRNRELANTINACLKCMRKGQGNCRLCDHLYVKPFAKQCAENGTRSVSFDSVETAVDDEDDRGEGS